jgi:hypothetical protein
LFVFCNKCLLIRLVLILMLCFFLHIWIVYKVVFFILV